ncbi:hypothetical protein RCL1_005571 [Eukaryota sp. TZLM3-RCL]
MSCKFSDITELLPEHHFDGAFIQNFLLAEVLSNEDEDANNSNQLTVVSKLHSLSSSYDFFSRLLSVRLKVRKHINQKAYDDGLYGYATGDIANCEFPLPISDALSLTHKLNVQFILQVFRSLPPSTELYSSFLSDILCTLTPLSCGSLLKEDSDTWLDFFKLISDTCLKEESPLEVKTKATQVLYKICLITGSLPLILSFFCGVFNIFHPKSISPVISSVNLSPSDHYLQLSARNIEIPSTYWKINDESDNQTSFKLNFQYPASLNPLLAGCFAKSTCSGSLLYLSDLIGISVVGTGSRNSVPGHVYAQKTWSELEVAINSDGFGAWLAVSGDLLLIYSQLTAGVIILNRINLEFIDKKELIVQEDGASYAICSGEHNLIVIKMMEIGNRSVFHFGYGEILSDSDYLLKVDDWINFPNTANCVLTDKIDSNTFTQVGFFSDSNFLTTYIPSPTNPKVFNYSVFELGNFHQVFYNSTCCQQCIAYDSAEDNFVCVFYDKDFSFIEIKSRECELYCRNYCKRHPKLILESEFFEQLRVNPENPIPLSFLCYAILLHIDRFNWNFCSSLLIAVDSDCPEKLSETPFVLHGSLLNFELLTCLSEHFFHFLSCSSTDILPNFSAEDVLIILLRLIEGHFAEIISREWSIVPLKSVLARIKSLVFEIPVLRPNSELSNQCRRLIAVGFELFYLTFDDRSKILIDCVKDESFPFHITLELFTSVSTINLCSIYVIPPTTQESINLKIEPIKFDWSPDCSLKILSWLLDYSFSCSSLDSLYLYDSLYYFISDLTERIFVGKNTNLEYLVSILIEFCNILISRSISFISGIQTTEAKNFDQILRLTPIYRLLPMIFDCLIAANVDTRDYELIGSLINQIQNFVQIIENIRSSCASLTPISPVSLSVPHSDDIVASPVNIGTKILESRDASGSVIHPYENNQDYEDVVTFPGAQYLTYEFDPLSCTERRYDYLTVSLSSGPDNFLHKYTGSIGESNWPVEPIKIDDTDTLCFRFHSDSSNVEWGYKVTIKGYGRPMFQIPELSWLDDVISTSCALLSKLQSFLIVGPELSQSQLDFSEFFDLIFENSGLEPDFIRELIKNFEKKSVDNLMDGDLQSFLSILISINNVNELNQSFSSIQSILSKYSFQISAAFSTCSSFIELIVFYFYLLLTKSNFSNELEVSKLLPLSFAKQFSTYPVQISFKYWHQLVYFLTFSPVPNNIHKYLKFVKYLFSNIDVNILDFCGELCHVLDCRKFGLNSIEKTLNSNSLFLRTFSARALSRGIYLISLYRDCDRMTSYFDSIEFESLEVSESTLTKNFNFVSTSSQISKLFLNILAQIYTPLFSCFESIQNPNSLCMIELSALMSCFFIPLTNFELNFLKNETGLFDLFLQFSETINNLANSNSTQDTSPPEFEISDSEDEEMDPDFLVALQIAAEDPEDGEQRDFARETLKSINESKRKREMKKKSFLDQKQKTLLNRFVQLNDLFKLFLDPDTHFAQLLKQWELNNKVQENEKNNKTTTPKRSNSRVNSNGVRETRNPLSFSSDDNSSSYSSSESESSSGLFSRNSELSFGDDGRFDSDSD